MADRLLRQLVDAMYYWNRTQNKLSIPLNTVNKVLSYFKIPASEFRKIDLENRIQYFENISSKYLQSVESQITREIKP
jgi:hypothetical protein